MAETIVFGERVGRREGILVGLSGELDLQRLPELRTSLSAALDSQRRVWVDLSGITFIDALCLRELAVQYQLHPDRLVLWRPSPEVRLAAAICEAEDWVRFHPDRGQRRACLRDQARRPWRQAPRPNRRVARAV